MSTRPPPRLREEVRVLRVERREDVPAVAIVPVDTDAEGVLPDEVEIPGGGAPLDAVAGFGAAIPQTLQ
jgi:hypothetical protein